MKRAIVLFVAVAAVTIHLSAAAPSATARVQAVAGWSSFGDVPSDADLAGRGLRLLRRFVSVPAAAVAGPERAIRALGAERIEWDRPIQFTLDTATRTTRAADVWGTSWWPHPGDVNHDGREQLTVDGQAIDGTGITAAVVDTGINGLHPDLWYAGAQVGGAPFEAKTLECVHGWSLAAAPSAYCDETSGHGSHVAGIIAGNAAAVRAGLTTGAQGPYLGVAPGAKLVGAGIGVPGGIVSATAALDWVYANAERYGVRVVNNSWGSFPNCTAGFPNEFVAQISNALVADKQVVVVFAAGNGGSVGRTNIHGRNPTPGVVAVANYRDGNTVDRDGSINSSSSDGCIGEDGDQVWTWPDVAAPGTSITSTISFSAARPSNDRAGFYDSYSGTSMAAPHVAGVVALMFHANPDLTPAEVERILIETATPWSDEIESSGFEGPDPHWGAVNVAAGEFVDRSHCRVTPEHAADPDAASAVFPRFDELPDPELYVCRDFKRGVGLVDAHAAVRRALDLRSGA